jgi:hypothetical protein
MMVTWEEERRHEATRAEELLNILEKCEPRGVRGEEMN